MPKKRCQKTPSMCVCMLCRKYFHLNGNFKSLAKLITFTSSCFGCVDKSMRKVLRRLLRHSMLRHIFIEVIIYHFHGRFFHIPYFHLTRSYTDCRLASMPHRLHSITHRIVVKHVSNCQEKFTNLKGFLMWHFPNFASINSKCTAS